MALSVYSKARRPKGARTDDHAPRGETRPRHQKSAGQGRALRDRGTALRSGKGHGRRLHGLGEDPGLANLVARYSPEKLATLPPEGSFCVHIAPRGLMGQLVEELGDTVLAIRGRAVLARGNARPCWAQTSWLHPLWIPIDSISDAARKLVAMQRRWSAHLDRESGLNRRATLIEEALPHVKKAPLVFGEDFAPLPMGAFLLWNKDLVLASAQTTSPFADGEVHFVENREDPPGRAYLKLWEAFTIFGIRPGQGELCLELGAAPGSWTWVLGNLGARVFSIDKAPLAAHVESMPNVNHCLGSGFALTPDLTGRVDWLFSDMICYPQRLLALVQQYIEARAMRHALCTIKFQSSEDHNLIAAFASIEGAQIRHLSCNKHELTWLYSEP